MQMRRWMIVGSALLLLLVAIIAVWSPPPRFQGYVYQGTSQSVPGVAVVWVGPGGDTLYQTTNADGFFIYDALSVRRAQKGKLFLERASLRLQVALDTVHSENSYFTFVLPPASAWGRVHHYDLSGHAIDKVLRRQVDAVFEQELAANLEVEPNAVYRFYDSLLLRYGQPLGEAAYLGKVGAGKVPPPIMEPSFDAEGRSLANYLPGKGAMASTIQDLSMPIDENVLANFLGSEKWEIAELPSDGPGVGEEVTLAIRRLDGTSWQRLGAMILARRRREVERIAQTQPERSERGFGNRQDRIRQLQEAQVERPLRSLLFWDALLRGGMPEDLFFAAIRLCMCPPHQPAYTLHLLPPELHLQVMVVEKPDGGPKVPDTLQYQVWEPVFGMPVTAAQALVERAPRKRVVWSGSRVLKPGVRRVLPMFFYAQPATQLFWTLEEAARWNIEDQTLVQTDAQRRKAYLFGPLYRPELLLGSSDSLDFRKVERHSLTIRDYLQPEAVPTH